MKENTGIELRLNMQMILDDLEDHFTVFRFHSRRDRQKLRGVCIYYGQPALNPEYAYCAPAEEFIRHPVTDPEICVISVGCMPEDKSNCPGPLIEVSEEANWQEVFNQVQTTVSRYFLWEQRLAHILNSGGGLFELCTAAVDFFQNPLYVHDPEFNVLAMPTWVVGMLNMITNEETGNISFPLRKIQDFERNIEYINSLSTQGAKLWVQNYMKHRTMYVNIWSKNQRYRGRLIINELNTSFKPSQFVMAEYFTQYLVMAFEQNLYKTNSSSAFETVLQKLFLGNTVNDAVLDNRLKMVYWERKHNYICFVSQLKNTNNALVTCRKVASTIKIYIKECFSFYQTNEAYTVCNLTRSGYTEETLRERIMDICSTAEISVGASVPFQDFYGVREYYQQAMKALELGRTYRPEGVYHPFREYVLDYIIHHFSSEFSIETVCSNAVKALMEMDREKNTEYIRTLWLYLESGCHQTATAQALYIHRSTLIYRLEKIQELMQVDLTDADTRLYLQISLRLMKEHWENQTRQAAP